MIVNGKTERNAKVNGNFLFNFHDVGNLTYLTLPSAWNFTGFIIAVVILCGSNSDYVRKQKFIILSDVLSLSLL